MATKFLSAADVESAADAKYAEVEVPEWGGAIRLKSMTAGQSMKQLADLRKYPDDGMCIILIYSAVNEADEYTYSMDRVDEKGVPLDLIMLRQKSMHVLDRIQRVCVALNKEKPTEEVKKA
ncbi:MAG TPA: hypothetical protein VK575_11740 [Gemmatimonadaceae bacterium]|nr:hypothetical protein [Gemmatimonadaceae bacterium]